MAATEWIAAIDKRPGDRNRRDADLIAHRLRRVEALDRLPSSVLHQLALVGYYEDLEKGVTLFRQGDPGSSWYAVLAGSVEVRYEGGGVEPQNAISLGALGVGSTFGDSILNTMPRDTTVVTRSTCELLRVERRDFKAICEKNKELMDQFVSSCKLNNKNGFTVAVPDSGAPDTPTSPASTPMASRRSASPEPPDPAKPITDAPGAQAVRIGFVLRHLLAAGFAPESLRAALTIDGQAIFMRGRRAWTGSDLVDWLIEVSGGLVRSRQQACAMWQCLLEEGVILHVAGELPFLDTGAFYRFFMDKPPGEPLPTAEELEAAEDDLHDAIDVMNKRAPHATLRYILRKAPHERTEDDLEMVYDELMRIRALSHLGNSVRRELAHVIVFESHPKAGEVLFQQGDEGHSWYIILRGSVDVVIHGKGVVTSLSEGDDFGKLALINDAPRAASIVLREPNCHFLRVDKDHFNRILRDVEANTVRLKEHGQDVLILEKISNTHSHFKYTVMAGTSQKMLEHLLETRLVGSGGQEALYGDPFLEDFLLTHIVFMPMQTLVSELARHYRIEPSPTQEQDFLLACKRRVVQFVNCWVHTVRHPVFDDPHSLAFLEELASEVEQDAMSLECLQEEAALMHHVMSQLRRYQEDRAAAAGQKWKLPPCGQPVAPFTNASATRGRAVIRPTDDIIFRVYCADHTYCTLRCPVSSTAEHIKLSAADKLKLGPTEDLVLVEVRSSGERIVIADNDLSVPTGLGGLNARLFVAPREHIDALTPLPEQEGATEAIEIDLELFSMKELAYHMTLFDWDLFWSVHEYELLYKTFGRQSFNQITANLDVFLRRFNEIQYWVITEVCLATQLSKRVSVLRKMIKLAQYCRDYKNLNALFAIVMGLGNVAVSRLSLTWEKLPSKSRKLFTELEALIDPTRNHRAYRLAVARLSPPIIPFMPLLIKDMTFTHEGNKTFSDGKLVNFEKMHMLAQTMRSIRNCRSRHLVLEPFSPKCEQDIKEYIASLRVIDNTRTLTSLSHKLEPRRS